MNFKIIFRLILSGLFSVLVACGDADDEANLVNLHTAAQLDIIAINFPADSTETIISISSEFDYSLQGLKSNGVDLVTLTKNVQWSLSENAASTIDKNGHFTASPEAELITLTAQFGHLIESIEIKVSSAKFDQVVELNKQPFSIDMCRSQEIKPIARYVDEDGNDEIRPVDSIIINTIEWIIRDQDSGNPSKRAHIETKDNQAAMRTLAAGNIIVQAKAESVFSGSIVTSTDFNQSIDNGIQGIKLCDSSATDLSNCSVSAPSIEQDKILPIISVGTYQAADGSSFNENISQNSKWGVDIVANASIALSSDQQLLNVTGKTENTAAIVSVACGDINQSLDGTDITEGVTLNSSVSCSDVINCAETSVSIDISNLTVTSFNVEANGIRLTDNQTTTLSSRPDEIKLLVKANFSNGSTSDITSDTGLVYSIIAGKDDVIEDKTNSPGIFTVLGNGTAEIKLDYREEVFIAAIAIP